MILRVALFILAATATVWAQGEAPAGPPQQNVGGFITQYLMMLGIIFLIFYFLLIRPQQKQRKEHEAKINTLKKGDRIMTTGGIYGTIVGIKEKENIAVLRVAENVKIEVSRSAIGEVVSKEGAA